MKWSLAPWRKINCCIALLQTGRASEKQWDIIDRLLASCGKFHFGPNKIYLQNKFFTETWNMKWEREIKIWQKQSQCLSTASDCQTNPFLFIPCPVKSELYVRCNWTLQLYYPCTPFARSAKPTRMALNKAAISAGLLDRSFVLAWWHFNGAVLQRSPLQWSYLSWNVERNTSFSSLLTARSEHDQCRQGAIWSNPRSTHLPASFRNTGPDFLLSTAEKEFVGGRICSIFYLGTHSIYPELCQLSSVLNTLLCL